MNKIIPSLIGGFILWSIIHLTINFYQNKKSNNSIINETGLCRLFSMSIEECKLYKKTGKLPKRVKDKLDEITKKIESNSLNQSSIHESEK